MNAEQVVRKYFDGMNVHDANRLATTMTDDYIESGFLPNLPPSNKQQSIENNKGFFQAFPDINFQIESMAVQGDQVTANMRVSGTHKGTLQGPHPVPATGKRFSVPDKVVMTIRGARVAAFRFESPANGGPAEAFKQIGVPLPG